VVDQLVGLHSLETRATLQEFLRRPPGSDLGLDLATARSALRLVLMLVAGCATAALVLGFGALRRDRRSRLALTILAVPLFLGGLVTGGLWTSVTASASVFLWLGPSGDWFAGRSPARRTAPGPPRPAIPPQHQQPPSQQLPPASPPPTWQPPAVWQPPAGNVQPPPLRPRRRPGAVVTACVLAWTLSGMVIGLLSLTVGVVLASPDTFWDEALRQQPQLAEQGLSRQELYTAVQALGAVGILWAAAAIILGALVFRGSNGARIALAASGYTAAGLCLLGTLSSPLLVVPLLVCAVGASLLLRPESREWCQAPRN
jgi:succinate dehydrogenase/fumarate reductase cytochrome b subunit